MSRPPGARIFTFFAVAFPLMIALSFAHAAPIGRKALVTRHNPSVHAADALAPFSVGNGAFAFTADVTGLQSFPDFYTDGIPLSTQSQWGWHSMPNPEGFHLEQTLVDFDAHGRAVPYPTNQDGPAGAWLRANPHRLGLGRIGLEMTLANGAVATLDDIEDIDQSLDLWRGVLESRFTVENIPVRVETCCHPELDAIAVRIESPLIAAKRLRVTFAFAYGSEAFGKEPEDWTHPERHETTLASREAGQADLMRTLDADRYHVRIRYPETGQFEETARHHFALASPEGANTLTFTAAFSPVSFGAPLPDAAAVEAAATAHWESFWQSGGAIDLAGSTDPRAPELERRIVLSQYLTAIQCGGATPPQETGLTFNSWYGKFHLEMHWWHAAHFALWDRLPLLEKSLPWYQSILPMAQEMARIQGYAGARWPKMIGPDGREGPSKVGPLLIWEEPHPIYYAELCYRAHPDRATLERYRTIVFETAAFMASYAAWDPQSGHYVLGPPVIPAQERHDPKVTSNPTFELEYWIWALETAQRWRERLGLARELQWDEVVAKLAPLPTDGDVYLMAENAWVTIDHPSLLAAYGVLPGRRVDLERMRRTLKKVIAEWNWPSTWGWDYPMIAMTAARLGEPEIAVDALLMDAEKNRYLSNGHNYQTSRLPIYLPGNGGLLSAAAMMAAGWDGAPSGNAPGFPKDGTWTVRHEGLQRMP